ncbi:granule-bound starch synthase 1, chloroplastic/amyloplastic-like [Senna tora]|uniref:Granule-bound starch synthase 1, chloroplastic/amyloplastic-like n=1 Tax=Senna tora TaxID=362788 RepID=A0A835CIT4_9FABA|nr:granule-bound starch synthase 1, chloroplastic/amyloplastic-like [Senna tora]
MSRVVWGSHKKSAKHSSYIYISEMAMVNASSHIASRTSSHVSYGVMSVSSCECKVSPVGVRFLKQTNSHNGLRIFNPVDELVDRAIVKASRTKGPQAKDVRPSSGEIVCGMNLIFVGTEIGPWSKTGGLGDVLGGLPPAMAANGHRVMTIAPRYDQYKDAWDTSVTVEAALEAPRVLNLNSNPYFSGPYGEDVVFIANDWHTALLPCYLKSMYQPFGLYKNAKVAFCIHNIAYQGRFAFADFSLLNLPNKFRSSFDFIDGHVKPVIGRKINWMKAGILESHMVLTVSPYYAEELVSGVDKGVELDTILRKTSVLGIVNGMDVQEWNPSADKYISFKYDASTVLSVKPLLKEALQAEVGLPVDASIPLIAFIGRLEEQKGSDILAEAIPEFIEENVQIVALGTGKKRMEKQLEQLETLYPDKARGVAKFNVPLAHMIIAGADYILVPSRFEPCGLIQLQAMRYGTVPIVASTGGLVDTVKEGFTGFQMGAFNVECEAVDPADVTALASNVKRALGVHGTPAFAEMIKNCMAQDLSWKRPAKKWENALLSLGVAGSEAGIDGEEIAPQAKENVPTP